MLYTHNAFDTPKQYRIYIHTSLLLYATHTAQDIHTIIICMPAVSVYSGMLLLISLIQHQVSGIRYQVSGIFNVSEY